MNDYFSAEHKAPCHGCEKREVGCHANCEAYLLYKDAMRKASQEKVKRYEESNAYHDVRQKGRRRR